jgi:inner membrane protein
MASVGHIAIAVAAARGDKDPRRSFPTWSAIAGWSLLSIAADIDFIAFAFGIPYGDPLGHRGATHSLAFAALLTAGVAVLAQARRRAAARAAVIAAVVTISHPVLDAMTNHGLGCAFLWPFDSTRYVAPWRIVPTVPSFASLLTFEAVRIGLSELLLFSPILVAGLWPPRRRRAIGPQYQQAGQR